MHIPQQLPAVPAHTYIYMSIRLSKPHIRKVNICCEAYQHRSGLKSEVVPEILCDLSHHSLKLRLKLQHNNYVMFSRIQVQHNQAVTVCCNYRHFSNQEVCRFLILADLSQSYCSYLKRNADAVIKWTINKRHIQCHPWIYTLYHATWAKTVGLFNATYTHTSIVIIWAIIPLEARWLKSM